MAELKMSATETEHQLLWFIENYSYVTMDSSRLESPAFTLEGLERTSWIVALNPLYLQIHGSVSLFLERIDKGGPKNLSGKLEISIITAYGSVLYSKQYEKNILAKYDYFKANVSMYELYRRKNADFLPRDTLGVCCRMWRGEETPKNVTQYAVRTVIGIENVFFVHKIRNFSDLEMNQKKRIQILSRSTERCVFRSDLWVSGEDSSNGSIIVDFQSSHRYSLMRKQFSVIGFTGKITKLFDVDYRFEDADKKEAEMLKSFKKQYFLDNRIEFLPSDELTLVCECTFKTGKVSSETEKNQLGFLLKAGQNIKHNPHVNIVSKLVEQSATPIASENIKFRNNSKDKPPPQSSALDDFKALYQDRLVTDVQLKTVTESNPDHKTVVFARSKLGHDLKENKTYCIKVDDSENKIGRQLLLFMYSDSLEDLQWESALELFREADKYAVRSVKILCSYFLVDNLNPSNAGQLLILADRHNDKELKKLVEGFILKHDKEVFSSEEWKKLSETNSRLGMETMLLKYKTEKTTK